MRIDRGLLFWGLAIVIAGAIPLAVQQGLIARDELVGIWRLWPLILVAIGVAVLLSRTPLAVVGTLAAAVVVGGLAGAALAVGPGLVASCGVGEPDRAWSESGSLGPDAAIDVDFNCGRLDVGLAPSDEWQLGVRGNQPRVDEAAAGLTLRTREAVFPSRQDWDLRLPETTGEMRVDANAGSARLDLAGGSITRLRASVNAGEARLDLYGAAIDDAHVSLNAGSLTVDADGDTQLSGRLEVNAGSIELCAPTDAAVAIRMDANLTFSHNLADAGMTEVADDRWTRGAQPANVELTVSGNAASFNLREPGACDS